jgi:hypothetical protein
MEMGAMDNAGDIIERKGVVIRVRVVQIEVQSANCLLHDD